MRIQRLGPGDAAMLEAAGDLFDEPPDVTATERFLGAPNHHLLIAYDGDTAAGFVSGVELTHPDKGTEMLLYELAVDEHHQGRGIGRSLVEHLRDLARERGCYAMWTITEEENLAALATYARAGAAASPAGQMLTWDIDHTRRA